jgi:hypothetical protein
MGFVGTLIYINIWQILPIMCFRVAKNPHDEQ